MALGDRASRIQLPKLPSWSRHLALPDPKLPFQVIADASDAIGAVLMQNDKPIAFEGRILNDTERKYGTGRSCGACTHQDVASVSALLYAAVRCTHDNPNVYFLTKALDRDTKRKAEELACYDMDWQYLKGRLNKADPISRTAVPGSYKAVHQLVDSSPLLLSLRCRLHRTPPLLLEPAEPQAVVYVLLVN
jgi:hypothetical protein